MTGMYNEEFAARVRAQRAAAAGLVPDLPRGQAAQPVHTAFTGSSADRLRRVAMVRGETPQALARAIVAQALKDGSAEEGLGEARAETLAGGQGRRLFGGVGPLTMQQCAVLYLIGNHGGARGWCGWSAAALARLMPDAINVQHVSGVIATLAQKGLIERAQRLGRSPRLMRLSELGHAVWDELSGGLDDG